MIETHSLSKKFDNNVAVSDLNLHVERGEVFGFLGPNGAGKTTTVRMLCGLIAPSSGEARVAGFPLGAANSEIRRHVGILTEAPGLYERFGARYNLEFYARLYGLSAAAAASQGERYLKMLELWPRRDEPVARYSKGMKQKVAIARSLVHEPPLLFLDEPTSGLDPQAAHVVHQFIDTLRSEGRTIFICTHNLDEAERLCDRLAVMRRTIIASGAPAELRASLYGSRTVVELAAPATAYLPAVQALPFGAGAVAADNLISLPSAAPRSENPLLLQALLQAGAPVVYVREERASLQDVYLDLVAADQGGET